MLSTIMLLKKKYLVVPIIGSDQHQQFNQLEISDIIEARLEEILDMITQEVNRLGYKDISRRICFNRRSVAMPGILELAQVFYKNNVRIAVPDYIGVREPHYTTGVGLIKFAIQNAKIQSGKLERQLWKKS